MTVPEVTVVGEEAVTAVVEVIVAAAAEVVVVVEVEAAVALSIFPSVLETMGGAMAGVVVVPEVPMHFVAVARHAAEKLTTTARMSSPPAETSNPAPRSKRRRMR